MSTMSQLKELKNTGPWWGRIPMWRQVHHGHIHGQSMVATSLSSVHWGQVYFS